MKALSRILLGALLTITLASCGDLSLKGIISQKVATSRPPKVLFIIANATYILNNPANALAAYSDIGSVSSWDSTASNPTVAQLKAYDVVFMSTDSVPFNRATLSDNLAQYLDGGGKVILGSWDWSAPASGFDISGRLLTQYSPLQLGATLNTPASLGAHNSGHPIMAGVSNFSSSTRNTAFLSSGATSIASWNDSLPLVAEMGHVIALNVGIQYTIADSGLGWTGDGWTLLHNAVLYIWHKL